MEAEFEIRQMTPELVDQVAALERRCFSDPWSVESLEAETINPNAVYYVVMQDDLVLGYAGMHHVLDEGYITNVAVSPEHRGKGLAKGLIQTLLEFAKERHLGFITLEVRESNLPAIKLYEGFGFTPVGRRKGYYSKPKEDALLMTLFFQPGEN